MNMAVIDNTTTTTNVLLTVTATSASTLLHLPDELLADVASYLNPSSLYSLQLTNRRLSSIVSAEMHDLFIIRKDSILIWAASANNSVLMQRAIAEGAHVPYDDILNQEQIRSNDNTARVVLDVWAHSVRQEGDEPDLLYRMTRLRHVNVVRIMLERGMFPDRAVPDLVSFHYRSRILYGAIWSGCVEIVQLLFSCGFDVHTLDSPKRCFLGVLARRNLPLMKILLDAGILAVVTPYRGNGDPVHATARSGSIAMMQMLLQYGATVDALGKCRRTPLHQTVLYADRDEMRQFLLDNGADIDSKDDDRYTPFDRAVCRGNVPAVRMLLEYGADVGHVAVRQWDPVRAHQGGPLTLGERQDVKQALVDAGVVLECSDLSRRKLRWGIR